MRLSWRNLRNRAILRNSSDALSTTSGLSKLEGALPVYQECIVRETCAVEVGLANVPRFRAVNEEVVRFDLGLALEDTIGGVFVDEKGRAKALWAAYSNCTQEEELYEQFEGMPIGVAVPMLATLSPAADIVAAPADDEYGSQGPPSDDDGEGAHENNGSSKPASAMSPETQKMHDAVGGGRRRRRRRPGGGDYGGGERRADVAQRGGVHLFSRRGAADNLAVDGVRRARGVGARAEPRVGGAARGATSRSGRCWRCSGCCRGRPPSTC